MGPRLFPALLLVVSASAESEIVAFTGGDFGGWQTWDWDAITVLGFWTSPPDDVRARASEADVRLFQDAQLPDKKTWTNASARAEFAQAKAVQVSSGKLHGVFFDYEGNGLSKAQKDGYTDLAKEVSEILKPLNASVFVCVGARPTYEFRDYDYAGLSKATDFLFIMGYDAHFWDDYTCVLKGTCSPAEAPIKDVSAGVAAYLSQVHGEKLVLGLPWYGQRYTQVVLPINEGQVPYKDVLAGAMDVKGRVKTKEMDATSKSWKITCNGPCIDGKKGGVIWFDDAETLKPKYTLARDNHLRGVGVWSVDKLPVPGKDGSDPHAAERKAMWSAIAAWNQPGN